MLTKSCRPKQVPPFLMPCCFEGSCGKAERPDPVGGFFPSGQAKVSKHSNASKLQSESFLLHLSSRSEMVST